LPFKCNLQRYTAEWELLPWDVTVGGLYKLNSVDP
jgi:hypothetical protein